MFLTDTLAALSSATSKVLSSSAEQEKGVASSLGHFPVTGEAVNLMPALNDVRRLPEFQPVKPGLLDHLTDLPIVQQALKWLTQQLEHGLQLLQSMLGGFHPESSVLMPAFIMQAVIYLLWALLVTASIFAVYILSRMLKGYLESTRRKNRVLDAERGDSPPLELNRDRFEETAKQSAERGHYAEAMRNLYWAALAVLHETQMALFHPARSNQDYLNTLRDKPFVVSRLERSFLEGFGTLLRRFDDAFYGRRHITASDFTKYEADYQAFLKQVKQIFEALPQIERQVSRETLKRG